ncbi:universal stress protein [Propionivibrio dicarboxylicus]|uniref:Nucleotide-binding universal stress protein, UspA family n=1 Tax=Propionivibrio dicarboxylicus TaxID=83767 RepID=A0A1G8DGI6_9RHOO|nr:universal stress protein [Propionivibrio dicarboxylicus]SDH56724.1 Nucleotide-binding universal stress protein, UspA family [Propionivibrio dicarboxylicus]
MFKNILVPTDGSPLSQETVKRAISFAKEAGAKITAFYAKPSFPECFFGEGALVDPGSPEKFALMAEEEALRILDEVESGCREAQVPCETCAVESDIPYEAIIEVATQRDCDLIFMSSHGRRGIGALLLGSETHKVLTHSKIPVLVYR